MSSVPPVDERDQLAAEFALGVLERGERAQAERLVSEDSTFAALVEWWHERLAPLLDEIAPTEPGSELWARINAALDGSAAPRASNVVSIERALRRWKGVAATMTAVAAALLLFVAIPRPAPLAPPAPTARGAEPAPMTAAIADRGATSFMVAWSPGDRSLMVMPATVSPVANHSHELWLIPAGGKPISLGVVNAAKPLRMTMPASMAAQLIGSATLAVSAEPEGGSPTGQPTGPVIGSGKLESV